MRTLLPSSILAIAIFCVPALAQQSRPSPDALAKENKELKDYVEKLEKRIQQLNDYVAKQDKHINELRKQPSASTTPLPLIPNPNATPAQPREWWLRPYTPAQPLTPGQTAPPGAQRFRFNGQDVYVVPLRAVP